MIKIDNLTYEYNEDGDKNASGVLKGISLEINDGEFVAVVGHNGSGKSTLAKHLNAILLPCGGKVYVDGLDSTAEAVIQEIRRRVGMVFQNPDNQIVATIVEEDVAFAPENLGVDPDEIRRRVDEALRAVGMYEKRHDAPHNLSGGQKQRVAIAGILAMKPKYIVLDEPTAMLDPTGRKDVLDTIKMLNEEQNITVIIITHYMDEAAMAKRVVVISDGEIIMDGAPRDVFVHAEELKACGLEVPQTTELMYLLNKKGINVSLDVLTVDECSEEILKQL